MPPSTYIRTMSDNNWTAIILAAGLGKRMRSRMPKALHAVAGRPMVRCVLDAVRNAFASTGHDARCVVVVGHGADKVRQALGDEVEYAHQADQLGTGHAVAQAQSIASTSDHVLVLNADVPLITSNTIADLLRRHVDKKADMTFLTAIVDDAHGQGRIVRNDAGVLTGIVEEADADAATLAIHEVNAGVYTFRGEWLWPRLARLQKSATGEYYLTDLVGIAVEEKANVIAHATDDAAEAMGINDRIALAQADAVARQRIRERHMLAGVTLVDPATTYIDAGVEIGMDTIIHPGSFLLGRTVIGEDCVIGPTARIVDSTLGARCVIVSSTIEESALADNVDVGPYSRLRSDSRIGEGSHIGNFAEVKNSRLGRNTKMGHFSYLGDAQVGDDVNIGAGTITCNFDGVRKQPTIIGDGAFIGSDTMLIAPVEVGARSQTGAGSIINHDVPPDKLAVGAPARIRQKKEKKS